ncbi:MAG TPA: ornithine carbamoyltransferase [Sedimentisphaerales bacterium]|nr:ornithine carbamoyltransferase [Sedimentisphaerales bacterium]
MNDFISIDSCSAENLNELIELSSQLKAVYKAGKRDLCLTGKTLALLFEKPSLRTRISFQVAMTDLGGSIVYIKPEDIGGMIGHREPTKDMARVLERYVNGIMARTFAHKTVVELADFASIPVINALTDFSHPCQAMADVLTIKEHKGRIKGIKIAYIGDGNNVARSLAFASAKFGMKLDVASPRGYELDNESINKANTITEGTVVQKSDPFDAAVNADIIYTDTWVSMGQEDEKQKRISEFKGYQVSMDLVKAANSDVKVMHCLPAYRGLEISDEVMESKNSVVFDQAENRLHFQRALLKKLMS